jgi:hypothetical protein
LTGMDLASELRLVIERVVRRSLAGAVGQVAQGLLLIVLIPLLVILAVAIFGVLGIVFFGFYALLGSPQPLGAVVGLGWFFGSLLVLFILLVRGHRWLSRLQSIAAAPASAIDPYGVQPAIGAHPIASSPIANPSMTYQERVAAADARHAPSATPGLPPHDPQR